MIAINSVLTPLQNERFNKLTWKQQKAINVKFIKSLALSNVKTELSLIDCKTELEKSVIAEMIADAENEKQKLLAFIIDKL